MSHRVRPKFAATALCCALLLIAVLPSAVHADSDYRGFVDETAAFLYWVAWPTATYEGYSFAGVDYVTGGANVKIRLHGLSAFSGGPLWTDLVVEVRNGEISNLRWGHNNAVLAQPGDTIEAWGEIFAELNQELESSGGAQGAVGGASGYPFHFHNDCSSPVRLAIRYQNVGGTWHSTGWWRFKPGEKAYLLLDGERVTTNNSTYYFYAEATDRSGFHWAGDFPYFVGSEKVKMRRLVDKEGESDWSTTCTR